MPARSHPPFVIPTALALAWLLNASAAPAATRDKTRPTTPTNFRVTAKTPFSVTLAWSPSTDNSGDFNYRLSSTAGGSTSVTLPRTATSYTWNAGIYPGNTYWFGIYAVDAAGNASGSASVSATLPRDTVAPSKPTVTVTDVGPTHVTLAPHATDDGPYVFYSIAQDGGAPRYVVGTTVYLLEPRTTYTFTVVAYDYGNNQSPPSDPVTVTTPPSDPNDVAPPTMPPDLTDNGMSFPDGETWLFWDQSTDAVTPDEFIRYDIYVNGVLDHFTFEERTILYVTPGLLNAIHVVAVDEAGNESAPAVWTVDLR
jgi:hypothetical protein